MKIKEIENEVNYNIYYSNNKNKSDDISNDVDNIDNISFYSNDNIKSLEINNNKIMNNKIGINTNTNFKNEGFSLKSKFNMNKQINKHIIHLKL